MCRVAACNPALASQLHNLAELCYKVAPIFSPVTLRTMSKRIADLVRETLARESAKRREVTAQQIEALTLKYKPGGNWRLLCPGPPWEACLIFIAEIRDVGQATIAELRKSGALASAGPEGVEKAKRAIYEWISKQRDGYITDGLKNFLQARGTLIEQEVLTLSARVAEELAQVTKELLIRLSESAMPAKAAKK